MRALKIAFVTLLGLLVVAAIVNAVDPGLTDWLNSPAGDEAGRAAGRAFARWTIDNCLVILVVGAVLAAAVMLWARRRRQA